MASKCTKNHFRPGRAYNAPADPLVGWKGDIPPLNAFGASTHGAYDASVPAYNFLTPSPAGGAGCLISTG